jgi:hypothetical protein
MIHATIMQLHNAEMAYLVILVSSGLCIFIDKFFTDYRLLFDQLPGDYLDEIAQIANKDPNTPRELDQNDSTH